MKNLSKAEQFMLKNIVEKVVYSQPSPRTVFCVLICYDGYEVYGASSCKDLDKFDEATGKLYALRHALSRLYRTKYKY